MEGANLERRVSALELAQAMGVTPTWLRMLERRGKIPAARRDPGARRKWWPESEAKAIVAGGANATPEQRPQQPTA